MNLFSYIPLSFGRACEFGGLSQGPSTASGKGNHASHFTNSPIFYHLSGITEAKSSSALIDLVFWARPSFFSSEVLPPFLDASSSLQRGTQHCRYRWEQSKKGSTTPWKARDQEHLTIWRSSLAFSVWQFSPAIAWRGKTGCISSPTTRLGTRLQKLAQRVAHLVNVSVLS